VSFFILIGPVAEAQLLPQLKQQQLNVDKAKIELEETAELLSLQVEQTGNEITESWFQLKLSKISVEQAQENLKITDDNYRSGKPNTCNRPEVTDRLFLRFSKKTIIIHSILYKCLP
jgi:hypothetical protein